MAGQDHHVRVILEAINKGGSTIKSFFADADKDLEKYKSSLRGVQKAESEIFLFGGGRGRQLSSGRFDKERTSIERATLALRKFRQEAKAEFADRQKSPVGAAIGGFFSGRSERLQIEENIDKRLFASKEERTKKLDQLEKEIFRRKQAREKKFEQEKATLERGTLLQEKITSAEKIDNLRLERQLIEDRILADRKAKREENAGFEKGHFKRLKDRSTELKAEIFQIEQGRDAFIRAERVKLAAAQATETNIARERDKLEKRGITRPSRELIEQEEIAKLESDLAKIENRFERFGRKAGRGWGEFTAGIKQGRRGLSDLDKDLLRGEGRLRRFGTAIGAAVTGASSLVNVKWAIVISALQILGTLAVQFGTALVAMASSAILAASALGGAMLAGISQLIPAVGLLSAAFSRLGTVLDAVKLSDKLNLSGATDQKEKFDAVTTATQRASDARYALMKAGEAVSDAEFELVRSARDVKDAYKDQREAVVDLVEARRDAARDIVDANLNEKESALSLEEAELAVLEAKRKLREERNKDLLSTANIDDAKAQIREANERLAQARAEGDTAEITLALQQLSVAEQNLQALNNSADETGDKIKGLQIDSEQADINLKQARIRNQRAQEDASRLRKEGVEGSDKVKAAQDRVVQSNRAVADSQRRQVLATRSLRDAIHGAAIAAREEADARKAVTTATNKQSAAQQNLQDALADLSPTEKRLFRSVERIKEQYKKVFGPITDIITGAFARAVDRASILLTDPRLIRAAKTLANSIAGAIDTISRFTLTPEFRKFLEFTIDEAAKNIPILTRSFINLFRVFMRIAQGAGPLLTRLFERFEGFTRRLEQRSRNTQGIEKFFSVAERHLDSWLAFVVAAGKLLAIVVKLSAPSGKTLLDAFTNKLNEWAKWLDTNETRATVFFDNMAASVRALSGTLATAAKVLFEAFSSEQATSLTQFILEVFIPAFTLFLGILGKVAQLFVSLTNIPLVGELIRLAAIIVVTEKLFNKLIPSTQKLTNLFFALIKGGFKGLGNALAETFPLFSKFINEAILRAQIALLQLRAALMRTTIAQLIFNKAVLANPYVRAAFAIAALIAILVGLELKFQFVTKSIKIIEKVFRATFNWIKDNWKLLGLILVSPFVGVAFVVNKFRDDILRAGKAVIDFFKFGWMRDLRKAITEPFIEAVADAYDFGRDLVDGLIDGIVSKATDLKNKIIDIVKAPWELAKSFFGIGSPSRWTKDNIGKPLAEGITEGIKEGMRGTGTVLTFALRDELRQVEQEAINVRNRMLSQVGNLRSLVSSQLGLRFQDLTPAEKELQELDASETERSRKQQLSDASNATKTAKQELNKNNREVTRLEKVFANAKTAEKKRQAREELQAARQAQAEAKRQLEAALKQQAETERQVGVDRKRDRLNALAQEQREALEKSVAAEINRGDKLVTAFANTLKGEPSKLKIKRARSILDAIIGLIGGGTEGGKRAAIEYVTGFTEQFKKFEKGFERQEKSVTRKGKILAQQNKNVAQLLEHSSQTELLGALKQPKRGKGKTDLESLQFLINTGNIDIELARAIVGLTPDAIDAKITRRMLKQLVPGMNDDNRMKLIKIFRGESTDNDRLLRILNQIDPEDRTLDAFAKALKGIQLFQSGGQVRGGAGQPVPVIAHAGEWILNKMQQGKIAQSLGLTIQQAKMLIFGTAMNQEAKAQISGLPTAKGEKTFSGTTSAFGKPQSFNLRPVSDPTSTNPDGSNVTVWFIEMADGTFGQVSPRDARKIIATQGRYIPGYVRRSTHGGPKLGPYFDPKKIGGFAKGGVVQKFMNGGVVMPGFAGPMLQSFAEGGTVLQQSGFGTPSVGVPGAKSIEQNFNVTTQGETDWNYVMRLGAQHAQGSYT